MEMRGKHPTIKLATPILFGILLLGIGFMISSHSVPSAYASSTRIAMFTPSPDSLMSVINNHLTSNDVIFSFSTGVVNKYPIETRTLLGQSFPAITQAITTAGSNSKPITFVGYDNEANNGNLSTPPSELVDPAASTNTAADMVHHAGFKFAATPTRAILLNEYQGVQWSKVDMLVMQVQRISAKDSSFVSIVTKVSSYVKGENPNTLIYTQVNPTFDTVANIVSDVNSVRSSIDGVSIVCIPSQGCTSTMLDQLLTQLN